jgi:hypothetical protein
MPPRVLAALVAAITLCLSLSATTAAAAPQTVRLVYARGDGAADCPDEPTLRTGIIQQLGRDPFLPADSADAPALTVTALVASSGPRMFGRIELVDALGHSRGARQLDGRSCEELAPALELVIAMAIEPFTRLPPPPPPAPPPSPRARKPRPIDGQISAGVLAALDAAPASALGFSMQVTVVRPHFSLGLELRGDLPTSAPSLLGGTVETALVAGLLAPCWRHQVLLVCALGGVGLERGAGGNYDHPARVDAFWAALGARLAFERILFDPIGLRLSADLLAPLTRSELYVGPVGNQARLAYRTPTVSSAFTAAVTTHF